MSGSAGPARTASPYSRFIPREELGAFAAWHPDTLNAELEPAAAAAPPAEAAAPPAQVAAARQAGYQDGYRDGLVALDSFKQSFAMQMTTQLGQLVQSFHTQIDALEQQMAQAVAQAAVMLARRVVRAEVHAHPEQVAELATQAVNAVLQSARQIRVLVHPEAPADVIGLGRPLCAMPDGAAQLLAGLDRLPRAEDGLALFPPALAFLKRIKALRAVDSFAAQYWFYCQIYALGRTGQTEPGKSVLAALLEVERTHKAWLKARRAATPA
mgnify:CR=1 FL=1